ncbi:MAG: hypothetical protein JO261_09110 [Alphaproteobacteria bacterium]|nr:hypothetical protein [Alphaproteobacteria bacterium]MBV9693848.1 hypothetical protein [Alphaproteobacteria bacterium]
MVNVSATGWTPQDAGRSWGFEPTRPRLLQCAFAEQPLVGVLNTLEVKSRGAQSASLRIRQDGELLFDGEIPPNAEIGIVPLTPAELFLSLTLEPSSVVHNLRVRPKVVAPVFSKIDVARQGLVGDSLPVVWEASDATSVTLHIEDGDERVEHTGTSAGVFMLRPARPGPILLRLVAQGPFATSVETRTVQVTIALPHIEIDAPVQSGGPGTAVAFHWRISGAREAFIDAPARGETYSVALDGGMVVEIETTTEEFHLVAIGVDGSRRTERFSTIPRLIGCLDEP